MYGDVYLIDPIDGKPCFYDYTSHERFVSVYAAPNYDMGRFFFVLTS